ncbi:hypothetical protein EKD04_022480 [Chloroflexales bacterium ZM16-3]|nr:hypothetical protein [Chloroflexales bacterium ZM16-3]
MIDATLIFDKDGLDPEAQEVVGRRRQNLQEFVDEAADVLSHELLDPRADDATLRAQLLALAPSIRPEAYLPLAQQLGFVDANRRRIYLRAWRLGMLSRSIWLPYAQACKTGIAPIFAEIERRFLIVLQVSPHVTNWIAALSEQHLCRDDAAARRLAYDLDRVSETAANQARDLVLTWCRIGQPGLLKHADYTCFDELMLVQRYEQEVAERRSDAAGVQATLRSDVIGLYRAFHDPEFLKAYQASYGANARPWDQSLLHQPPDTEVRQAAQLRIPPLRPILIPILSRLRGETEANANALLDALLRHGLPDLVAFRCAGGDTSADMSRELEQICKVAAQLLRAVQPDKREQILTSLRNLHGAAIASGVSFPLMNLIRHLPSSTYRRKRQRRKILDSLIEAFAEREGLTKSAAGSSIKNLMIYGPLGLLPQREWSKAIHPRLWSYLYMVKLGRLEDTVSESVLTGQVNEYARLLGVEPLPKQIVIGIYGHFRKNTYYNSGDGEAIAAVPLRKALKLAGVARLHEQWLLLTIELDIDLVSPALRSLGGACWVVLVLDCGSQRPVGLWLSEKPPRGVESGLALYDALFHRTALHWPLRGIPEHILLPQTLLDGADNLRKAAAFLMAELEPINSQEDCLKKLPYARDLIGELTEQYKPALLSGRRRAPKRQLTIPQADEEIRSWLYTRCFPNHRTDPVPASLRKHGFALPGYDTPAAGWLLPVVAEHIQTVRNGVRLGKRAYIDPQAGIEPSLSVHVRMMPSRLGSARAVFIEHIGDVGSRMDYLPLASRS